MFVRFMRRKDIVQVSKIDRESFPDDWPPTNFNRELENRLAHYIVVCRERPESVIPPDEEKSPPPKQYYGSFIDRIRGWFSSGDNHRHESLSDECEDVLGYAGIWFLADEAHITSIASGLENRRQGIGEFLLLAIMELAARRNVRTVTLEVRVSNRTAQQLYRKYGFRETGLRKGYYLNNKEDAIIMSTEYIGSESFQEHLENLKEDHLRKCGPTRFKFVTRQIRAD